MNHQLKLVKTIINLVVLCFIAACTPNKQLRTEFVEDNCLWGVEDCRNSIIEHYLEYDLGFIEFTERGNLYDRLSSQRLLSYIQTQARSERGAAVFVFVHGWKHNSNHNDTNVVEFREFLSRAAENEVIGKRKVIGLYLGWRGSLTDIPLLRETTYWGRKSVAEEVGAGGATEIFAKLHQVLVARADDRGQELYKNSYVIIGHSFGGAIVLSALHDVLLNNLVAANPSLSESPQACSKIRRFADALILLNPAIEANKVILLKEATARCIFDSEQVPLMHILSSDGDNATRVFFPLGEYVNFTSPLSPKKLPRTVNGKDIILDERQLSLNTVGNLEQLRTSYLSFDRTRNNWSMNNCEDDLDACRIFGKKTQKNHFTVSQNDPLRFIKTDQTFIKNHNDVFSCYTQGFISSVIFETQFLEKGFSKPINKSKDCINPDTNEFDFMKCFNSQLDDYDCDQPQ